ncbi:DTW domain-containing protein 1 [Terramyces sp. JEL0728]|nr:DTW domain-containing protein 1 [Terramyces sp. JEL0728]
MTDPFVEFKIDPTDILATVPRSKCPKCQASVSIYCPDCSLPIGHQPPAIDLPIHVDILRHPGENHQKTTTTHCKLIARDKTTIYIDRIDENFADKYDTERVLLLFPSEKSVPLSDIKPSSFDRLLVIDGTWKQAKGMAHRLQSMNFRHVRINSHETLFWRHQIYDRTFLATIEAIYWFFQEYHTNFVGEYTGQYDNLLYYFKFNWEVIQTHYKKNPDLKYTTRHAEGRNYIKYDNK